MTIVAELAIEHLLLRLRPLNRALRVAVERQGRAAKRLIRPDVTPLCVTEDQVLTLLRDVDALAHGDAAVEEPSPSPPQERLTEEASPTLHAERKARSSFWRWCERGGSRKSSEEASSEDPGAPAPEHGATQTQAGDSPSLSELTSLTKEERAALAALRNRGAAANACLPLDRLAQALSLTPFEEEAVLLCAAPEIDRCYERIYAYILDDLNRRYPCVELLSTLTASAVAERLMRQHGLSRFGRLRRLGVLQPYGEPPTELRQELRLAPGLFEYLTGGIEDAISRFRDSAEVTVPEEADLPPQVDVSTIQPLIQGLRQGRVSILGIWGPQHSGKDAVVLAIAAKVEKPLRRCWLPDTRQGGLDEAKSITDAVQVASALGAVLWIATESLTEPGGERLSQILADALAASQAPVLLTGVYPWRPLRMLEARSFAEIELEPPGYSARKAMWSKALPDVNEEQLGDLAARFRVSGAEIGAAARLSKVAAALAGNGHKAPESAQIEQACTAVTRNRSHQFATVIKPKRRPEDLILPAGLHDQVMEVAHFSQSWPRVAEDWGFGRLETGNGGGIKALFTGDSGTGKTLAAEVIAWKLNMPLLKVDLARVVSKWVGETEQHLEAAFREAEDSHAVLCFNEADALFGKRGEVQHGVDRYANLEVSYLLQRLEDHYGCVILTSNLKDCIDPAFTRRFQIIIHFPRPELTDRRRIWEIAFPDPAPLDEGIDLDALARLDMTGAAIVGAAQTAALLAADESSATITKSHVVRAIARQYKREARILTPAELGPYAADLKEAR